MAVTSQQVREVLDRDEPDYEKAAEQLGPEALPILRKFVEGGDPSLAPKAVYLAGLIGDADAQPILELAAGSDDPSMRAAAAHGARHLRQEQAEEVLLTLLDDDDAAVRKTAVRAVPRGASEAVRKKLKVLRDVEPEPMVRDMAATALDDEEG